MTFWSGRRVFVTGCTGFLGWQLTEALLQRGADVVGLVRDLVPSVPFFVEKTRERVTVVRGGVEDYAVLERALNEYEIDTVFHLAAQAIVGTANRNPVATFETNIRGTWLLLEACRRNEQISRIVVASSDKAYGSHEQLPYTEDFPLQGEHPYDVSKSCADLIARAYHNTYGTPVGITRCGNLFGPGDLNFSRIIPGTIRSVLGGERPVIRSDGTPMRDYVHVMDVVAGYLLLAARLDDATIRGRAFNFGSGEPQSVLELTRKLVKVCGREDLEPVVLDEMQGEIQHQYLSADLVKSVLGWEPSAPLEARLAGTADWYREFLPRVRQ